MYLLETGKIKIRPTTDKAKEHARRQDIGHLTKKLKELKESGEFAGNRDMALQVATDILKNLAVKPRGRRWSTATQAWMGVLRAHAGIAEYNVATVSAMLPHERSARTWGRGKGVVFNCKLTDQDFALLAELYTQLMNHLGIPLGSVPMAIAEDETALIAKAEFDCVTHSLLGYCGTRCARRCQSVWQQAARMSMAVSRTTRYHFPPGTGLTPHWCSNTTPRKRALLGEC